MQRSQTITVLKIAIGAMLLLNTVFWFYGRYFQAVWANVPPPPRLEMASGLALGDQQFASRIYGVMIQNIGEYGGRSKSFELFNYNNLQDWFFLLDKMDPNSSFVPFLAAYYFSGVKNSEGRRQVIDYLVYAGLKPGQGNWRWLGQAITLARFELEDQDLALDLAYKLAAIDEPGMPGWARQMPAFILNAKGNKKEAYDVMFAILKSNVDTLHPNEIFFTKDYICNRLLNEQERAESELCQNL